MNENELRVDVMIRHGFMTKTAQQIIASIPDNEVRVHRRHAYEHQETKAETLMKIIERGFVEPKENPQL